MNVTSFKYDEIRYNSIKFDANNVTRAMTMMTRMMTTAMMITMTTKGLMT